MTIKRTSRKIHNPEGSYPKAKALRWFLFLFICFSIPFSTKLLIPAKAQTITPPLVSREKAETLLEEMTPEQKVGQLFLVTFTGIEISQ